MIEITGMLLLLCVLGGTTGGLVNHTDRKQKGLIVSLMTACVVSLPVTWVYVSILAPKLHTAFLQNRLSTVMIAIVSGAAGAIGMKTAAQRFGLELFESCGGKEPAETKAATVAN